MTAKPHLPPSPIDAGKVTVTAIESVQPLDLFPDLLLVRVHTDWRAGAAGRFVETVPRAGRAGRGVGRAGL